MKLLFWVLLIGIILVVALLVYRLNVVLERFESDLTDVEVIYTKCQQLEREVKDFLATEKCNEKNA